LSLPDPASPALLRDAVLVGLTPLIPLPFVDDLARVALRRRLVRGVAELERVALDPAVVEALAGEPSGGCLGTLPRLLLYPIKKIFRKIFFFLEVKRAMDLVSTSWHYGWLLQVALRTGHLGNDPGRAGVVRAEIERLLEEASVQPLERALRETLRNSRAILQAGADLMGRALRGTRRRADRVEQAVEAALPGEHRALDELVGRLQAAVSRAPREHLDRLAADLQARVGPA
jgi:hypothetical protein